MEAKREDLKKYESCEFSISFSAGDETVKSKNYRAKIAYKSIVDNQRKYIAADGCGLIGCVITGIPSSVTSFDAIACLKSSDNVETKINLGSAILSKGTVTLTRDEIYDKLLGGWLGQMIGVSWGASTEFGYCGEIIPENRIPKWKPSMINDAFAQDDLYVEIPFMEVMKKNGVDCDVNLIADNFAKSEFPLWHANYQARLNLQNGIKYPDSGSPKYNIHADDIDWQIEADFLGMIYPGLVNRAAERSFELGHIMNYGDGVYGGVFVSALHSAAYTARTLDEVIQAGLDAIPDGTLFKETLLDVVNGYNNGESWEDVWKTLENKWADTDKCTECAGPINIDAKLNSAYVLIGLLYGAGNLEKTIIISTRCGQDSDCNPSTAASVLCNFLGASAIPDKYKSAVDMVNTKFQTTDYSLGEIIDLSMQLISETVSASGGRVKENDYTLVVSDEINATPFEQWEGGIGVQLLVNVTSGCAVNIRFESAGAEKIKKVTYDMGDGFVTSENLCMYGYSKPGTYRITCEVEGEEGTKLTLETTITLESELSGIKYNPICSVDAPLGSGNKDMHVFCDGVIPSTTDTSSALQYDTYCGGGEMDSLYVGMEFDKTVSLTGVKFTEGLHFWDGGWFDGVPNVELLIDGKWVEVATYNDGKEYPDKNSMTAHGLPFESYVFRFEKTTECDGVRFKGKPGGSAHFISVAEITPFTNDNSVTVKQKTAIICSVSAPLGGGSKDIGVICDGIVPDASSANDLMQYDTYIGETADAFAYVGYLFVAERNLSGIVFAEGNHFNNGGWFKNGDIKVQILTDEGWVDVLCDGIDRYPVGDSRDVFGSGYQSYTFRLKEPVSCRGIRIAGTTGGCGFISVSELTVID
ncbi:MAG: ADP-ribosylglycohydrolase family protein [Eubacteriales bacterium]